MQGVILTIYQEFRIKPMFQLSSTKVMPCKIIKLEFFKDTPLNLLTF